MASDDIIAEDDGGADKLTSEELAELIVDALLRANMIARSNVARSIQIATEEIEVRKAMRDY
jgi:hypothetical protein